jgi:hypothetical protein
MGLNVKPNEFPVKLILDGSEELYTQISGVNYKFTLDTILLYIFDGVDFWDYKEVEIGANELSILAAAPIQLLDETLLAVDEYYEINRIIIENNFNTLSYSVGGVIPSFYFVDTISYTDYKFQEIPISFVEATEDLILQNYVGETHIPYARNTGLYIKSSKNITSGDGTFKVKIYYKISS